MRLADRSPLLRYSVCVSVTRSRRLSHCLTVTVRPSPTPGQVTATAVYDGLTADFRPARFMGAYCVDCAGPAARYWATAHLRAPFVSTRPGGVAIANYREIHEPLNSPGRTKGPTEGASLTSEVVRLAPTCV